MPITLSFLATAALFRINHHGQSMDGGISKFKDAVKNAFAGTDERPAAEEQNLINFNR